MGARLKQITGKPGLFRMQSDRGQKIIKLVEWKEDFVYDTVQVPRTGAAMVAGLQLQFFQNLQNKQAVDTNLSTPRRLMAGQEMILNQIGIMPSICRSDATQVTSADYAHCVERMHYEFRVNNIIIAEGPVHCFPPGMGVMGSSQVGDVPVNGVASPASVPRLLVPQNLNEFNDLQGILTHSAAAWLVGGYTAPTIAVGGVLIRNLLRGYVKVAIGKG